MVSVKIKDQHGLMKDRVRERIMSVKLDKGKKGIRKALDREKMTKCTPNDPNGG